MPMTCRSILEQPRPLPPSSHFIIMSLVSLSVSQLHDGLTNEQQIHACIAQGSTILAEHKSGKRDFSQG